MKPDWYCEKLHCWMMKSVCDLRRKKAAIVSRGESAIYRDAGCDKCTQKATMIPMEETKLCRKCGQIKPLSEFYKHKGCKGGLDNRCKECKRLIEKRRRDAIETSWISYPETPEKITIQNALATVERGPKDISGKPNWSIFPFSEAESVVKVFEHGANKYGAPFTYRKGIPPEELLSAIIRHAVEIHKGDSLDSESGCSHAAHIAANALMLISQIGG